MIRGTVRRRIVVVSRSPSTGPTFRIHSFRGRFVPVVKIMTLEDMSVRCSRPSAVPRTSALLLPLLLLLLLDPVSAAKKKHHWRANVIKNHLKNHKNLEGMVRLVDGKSDAEGKPLSRANEKFHLYFEK